MSQRIYHGFVKTAREGKKQLALLIDPDKFDSDAIIELAEVSGVDYFFVGGSILTTGNLEHTIQRIKCISSIPVILFPGNPQQISATADAILLLSLISGRNSEMLIGNHVIAAPSIRASGLEVIPTGYLLIDGGRSTSVSYISNTMPIPGDKNEIATCTAIAGELLGLKMIYLEAGSGATHPVLPKMIREVKNNIGIPLIVGGGIRTPLAATEACRAGADIIVIGTVAEENNQLVRQIADAVHAVIPVVKS